MDETKGEGGSITFKNGLSIVRALCVGRKFEQRRMLQKSGENNDAEGWKISEKADGGEIDLDIDDAYLKSLDPKHWKDQDHYAVLGLKAARFDATEDDIRRAYRKMVLKYHPDKRKAKGEEVSDDDFFTCITRAYEVLGNTKSRRSFDSVDPEFDDALPNTSEIEKDFYTTFVKFFTANARWSERPHVPSIGNEDSSREEVDKFYSFWYNFQSWREYSYLDEEDKEKGQDRDERRWIEKQNKAIRIKRKKEEMSRIRALVDLAYNNDPRIQKFKNEEKQKKLAAKRAKMDAVQAMKAEEERLIKEAQLAKQKAEQAEQKRIEQLRIEKEQQKRLLKKERKNLRDFAKNCDYFATSDKDRLKNMEGVEKLCELFKLIELQELNSDLQKTGKEAFFSGLKKVEEILENERKAMLSNRSTNVSNGSTAKNVDKNAMWSAENIQLLIKAVNLFPAGTSQRWEVVAAFMNQHASEKMDKKFAARDVLNKAKDLQSADFSKNALKTQANVTPLDSKKKEARKDNVEITVKVPDIPDKPRENGKTVCNGAATTTSAGNQKEKQIAEPKPWTKDEQALLEQAIKTYPISTADRWDRIAECIPGRTKKDCLRRVKELVDRVNAKKEAQQAVK